MSSASVGYLATCLMVDSLVSSANFVNFGTFHPLGNFVCKTKAGKGEEYVGLCRPEFILFHTLTRSTIASKFYSPAVVSYQICLTIWSGSRFLLTNITGGVWSTLGICSTSWNSCSIVLSTISPCRIVVPDRGGGGGVWRTCTLGAPRKSLIRVIWVASCL